MMADLFGTTTLPGLRLQQNIISFAEARDLAARIDAADLTPFRFHAWTGKRVTASFGWSYDFEAGRPSEGMPIPDWLEPARAYAARFAEVEPEDLVQALVTRYDPGAGIGWHRDRPIYDKVIGLSLGAAAVMRLRRRLTNGFARASFPLDPGGAYLLSGPVRREWEHSIAPVDQTRWSVTFRSSIDPKKDCDSMRRLSQN